MTLQEEQTLIAETESLMGIMHAADSAGFSPRMEQEFADAIAGLSEANDQLRLGGPLNCDEVDWRIRRGRAFVGRIKAGE